MCSIKIAHSRNVIVLVDDFTCPSQYCWLCIQKLLDDNRSSRKAERRVHEGQVVYSIYIHNAMLRYGYRLHSLNQAANWGITRYRGLLSYLSFHVPADELS
jgi:hypothetical protein